jgi:hypothetical protein
MVFQKNVQNCTVSALFKTKRTPSARAALRVLCTTLPAKIGQLYSSTIHIVHKLHKLYLDTAVADPDPHVFGPPGSGSGSIH